MLATVIAATDANTLNSLGYFILWLIAAALVITGIMALIRGAILWGIVLIVVGLLVGPGGMSLFT